MTGRLWVGRREVLERTSALAEPETNDEIKRPHSDRRHLSQPSGLVVAPPSANETTKSRLVTVIALTDDPLVGLPRGHLANPAHPGNRRGPIRHATDTAGTAAARTIDSVADVLAAFSPTDYAPTALKSTGRLIWVGTKARGSRQFVVISLTLLVGYPLDTILGMRRRTFTETSQSARYFRCHRHNFGMSSS